MNKAEKQYNDVIAKFCENCPQFKNCDYRKINRVSLCNWVSYFGEGYEQAQRDTLEGIINWLKERGNKYIGMVEKSGDVVLYDEILSDALREDFGYDTKKDMNNQQETDSDDTDCGYCSGCC